jgi:hypothetical protein
VGWWKQAERPAQLIQVTGWPRRTQRTQRRKKQKDIGLGASPCLGTLDSACRFAHLSAHSATWAANLRSCGFVARSVLVSASPAQSVYTQKRSRDAQLTNRPPRTQRSQSRQGERNTSAFAALPAPILIAGRFTAPAIREIVSACSASSAAALPPSVCLTGTIGLLAKTVTPCALAHR